VPTDRTGTAPQQPTNEGAAQQQSIGGATATPQPTGGSVAWTPANDRAARPRRRAAAVTNSHGQN